MNLFTRQYSTRVAYALVALSSTIWGLLWIPLRLVNEYGLHPIWVNALFMVLPAITLGFVCWRTLVANRHHWRALLAIAFFMGGGFVFYATGLIVASVSKTTVLFYLTPVWATVFGLFFLGERSNAKRWLAIGAALVGCLLVMRLNPLNLQFERADMFGFASGLFWGVGSVCVRRFPQVSYIAVTFSQYVAGALLAVIVGLIINAPIPEMGTIAKALPVSYVIAAMIFMPTVLIILRISQYVSPGLVGILMLSEVVFAVASSHVLLGEVMNGWQWLGVVAILLIGVWLGITANEDSVAETDAYMAATSGADKGG